MRQADIAAVDVDQKQMEFENRDLKFEVENGRTKDSDNAKLEIEGIEQLISELTENYLSCHYFSIILCNAMFAFYQKFFQQSA